MSGDPYADQYDFLGGEGATLPTSADGETRGRFEYRHKDARLTMRLPEDLLRAIKDAAAREGIPYQRFIRRALEDKLRLIDEPRDTSDSAAKVLPLEEATGLDGAEDGL